MHGQRVVGLLTHGINWILRFEDRTVCAVMKLREKDVISPNAIWLECFL